MRVAILAHEQFPGRAKTAVGVLRYGTDDVVAVLDRERAGTAVGDHLDDIDAEIPVVASAADAPDFDALYIGIAPIGGGFDASWRPDVRTAIERGADVVSGLHYFLSDDQEFTSLADEYGVELRDVRQPPADLTVADGIARDLDAEIVLTVGTDCSTGKMTTTLELVEAAREAGLDAGFVPTGQTGIMIAGDGIPIDRTISDFTAGAAERLVATAAEDHDYLFVEGQGSILHPAYSPVTCGLLHGTQPDWLVLCHEAGRKRVHGYEDFAIPEPSAVADQYLSLAEPVAPTTLLGGALNTSHLDGGAAETAIDDYADELGVPVVDPVRQSAAPIVEQL
ncbi:DUF1611 family protein [Natronomonas pharaonis DSM 2160]|uniref:DUF1611 family protein n=1 Tax=Natronomonas pharaonis (strain ATCC 35678 / DSM 2160 / CIP 103997 / JCM 8858 / NBRC 14720 / NCIMB 2260 / Gabara) TaxID=348780 RepID=A0A1U7EW80_NATPD|nr:DUF1611 domain-containing protein [Natronomonas pharaonis]CAI49332.1 DUF1611 family protein [Natronomonas pharaonis DSM 2160]